MDKADDDGSGCTISEGNGPSCELDKDDDAPPLPTGGGSRAKTPIAGGLIMTRGDRDRFGSRGRES